MGVKPLRLSPAVLDGLPSCGHRYPRRWRHVHWACGQGRLAWWTERWSVGVNCPMVRSVNGPYFCFGYAVDRDGLEQFIRPRHHAILSTQRGDGIPRCLQSQWASIRTGIFWWRAIQNAPRFAICDCTIRRHCVFCRMILAASGSKCQEERCGRPSRSDGRAGDLFSFD